jgi:hypothetical protein
VSLNRGLAAMAGSPTPAIANAVAFVNAFKLNVENDPAYFKNMICSRNEQQSRSLIAALGTTNKPHKVETLEKIYFSQQISDFLTLKSDVDALRVIFANSILFGYTVSYANNKGEIMWETASDNVLTSMTHRAFGAGRAAAKAAPAPAPAPAPAGADVHMG